MASRADYFSLVRKSVGIAEKWIYAVVIKKEAKFCIVKIKRPSWAKDLSMVTENMNDDLRLVTLLFLGVILEA